jgi:hypothetical protein
MPAPPATNSLFQSGRRAPWDRRPPLGAPTPSPRNCDANRSLACRSARLRGGAGLGVPAWDDGVGPSGPASLGPRSRLVKVMPSLTPWGRSRYPWYRSRSPLRNRR